MFLPYAFENGFFLQVWTIVSANMDAKLLVCIALIIIYHC
jgi:hypothetical protein